MKEKIYTTEMVEILDTIIQKLEYNKNNYSELIKKNIIRSIDYNCHRFLRDDTNYGNITIIPVDDVRNIEIKNELIKYLGHRVSVKHSNTEGALVGIAADNFDYYYAILTDNGEVKYNTCCDRIISIK